MNRILVSVAVALLVVTSGCVGLLTGDTVEFTAADASVSDNVLESTGYDLQNASSQNVTRNVSVAGQERTIRVENKFRDYSKGVDFGPLGEFETARFTLLSTPGATVAGQTLNPAADWSNERIADQIANRNGDVGDLQRENNRTTQSLGETRTVTEFSGTSTLAGQDVDMVIHVASFEHEGDVIVAVGAHPERIDETDNVDTLLGGIEHSGN